MNEQQEKQAKLIASMVGARIDAVGIGVFGHLELMLTTGAGEKRSVLVSGADDLEVALADKAEEEGGEDLALEVVFASNVEGHIHD